MADPIEKGYKALLEKLDLTSSDIKKKGAAMKERDAALLERMAELTAPFIQEIGLILLKRGKTDTKGEIYGADYHRKKMIPLGKTDPAEFRPDDPNKKVTDQFCVLSEEGTFFELMYSSDGFLVDSYLNPITPQLILQTYGYEPMFLLYRFMKEHLEGQDELLTALDRVLAFLADTGKAGAK
jgi:hypothetical protein